MKAFLPLALLFLLASFGTLSAQYSGYYVDQEGLSLANNFTVIAYNVSAGAQIDSNGIGPGYFIRGVSDAGYLYEAGLGYNWYGSGTFTFVYSVFGPGRTQIYPPNGGYGTPFSSEGVNFGDKVVLYMYYSKGYVVMIAKDWNTGAYASASYPSFGGTKFLGNPYSAFDGKGYSSGVSTIWTHLAPSNIGTNVVFSPYSNMSSPVRMWITRSNGYFYNNQYLSSPLGNLTSNLIDSNNQHVISIGKLSEKFYTGNFYTGLFNYLPLQLTSIKIPLINSDIGNSCSLNTSVSVTGGEYPYNFTLYIGNDIVQSIVTKNDTANFYANCAGLNQGKQYYYIKIKDSNHSSMNSPVGFITQNPVPQLISYALTPKSSFFYYNDSAAVLSSLDQGTSPYTYNWYVNNALALSTNSTNVSTIGLRTGMNQLKLVAADSVGYRITKYSYILTDYNWPHIIIVLLIILLIIVIIFFILKYVIYKDDDEYDYSHNKWNEGKKEEEDLNQESKPEDSWNEKSGDTKNYTFEEISQEYSPAKNEESNYSKDTVSSSSESNSSSEPVSEHSSFESQKTEDKNFSQETDLSEIDDSDSSDKKSMEEDKPIANPDSQRISSTDNSESSNQSSVPDMDDNGRQKESKESSEAIDKDTEVGESVSKSPESAVDEEIDDSLSDEEENEDNQDKVEVDTDLESDSSDKKSKNGKRGTFSTRRKNAKP